MNLYKRLLLFLLFLTFTTSAFTQPTYSSHFSIGDSTKWGYFEKLVIDSSDNRIVSGIFRNGININPGTDTTILNSPWYPASHHMNFFMAKYNKHDSLLWHGILGYFGTWNGIRELELDNDENIITAGRFYQFLDADIGPGHYFLNANNNREKAFICKYNGNGHILWAKQIECSQFSNIHDIAFDKHNNVYIAGYFSDTIDLNPDTTKEELYVTPDNKLNGFLIKLDSAGNYKWGLVLNSKQESYIGPLLLSDSGNKVSSFAWFTDTLNILSKNQDTLLESSNSSNILEFDSTGRFIHTKENLLPLNHVIKEDDNTIHIAGSFRDTLRLTDTSNQPVVLLSQGEKDIIIYTVDSTYRLKSYAHIGSPSDDNASYIKQNTNNELIASIFFEDSLDINIQGTNQRYYAVNTQYIYNQFSMLLCGLDSNKHFKWIGEFLGNQNNEILDFEVTSKFNIVFNASFKDTVDIDPGPDTLDVIAKHYPKGIMTEWLLCENSFSQINLSGCIQVTLPSGKLVTNSGQYQDTIINYFGCDSIISVSVSIRPSYSQVFNEIRCDSFHWFNGRIFYSDTTVIDTLSTIHGCDSVIVLTLDIKNSDLQSISMKACHSYTWINGQTYTQSVSGIQHKLTNQYGCDSTIILDLTILPVDSFMHTETACDSFQWINNETYYSDTSVSYQFTNQNGCDSVYYLDLIINNSRSVTDSRSACDSFTWIDNHTYLTNSSIATHLLQTTQGCDSLVQLDLTLFQSSWTIDSISACQSHTWINGQTYFGNALDTMRLVNLQGCDSIVILNLNIQKVDTGVNIQINTLESDQPNAQYRWLNCQSSNQFIVGETGQTYTPQSNGQYAVEVKYQGCIDTSACYTISNVSSTELSSDNVQIIPNPNEGAFQIKAGSNILRVIIFDSQGKLIKHIALSKESRVSSFEFDLAAGLYQVLIETVSGRVTRKLVIID